MKLNFETLYKGSDINFLEGNAKHWLELAWKFADKKSLNEYETSFEKILVYKRFYALICFYCDFVAKLDYSFSEKEDICFEVTFDELDTVLDAEDDFYLLQELIYDEYYAFEMADMLANELGVSTLFASLYFARNYDRFSLADYENDDFYYSDLSGEELEEYKLSDEAYDYEFRKRCQQGIEDDKIYDIILNEIDVDKLTAFEWLCALTGR